VHGSVRWGRFRRAILDASVALSTPLRPAAAPRLIVKSVFSALALAWVCESWKPRLVIVSRSALNTVASWRYRGWPRPLLGHPLFAAGGDADRDVFRRLVPEATIPPAPPLDRRLERLTWELCALRTVMLDAQAHCAGAVVVSHEDVCTDPRSRLLNLFDELGLKWSNAVDAFLASSNTRGEGAFDTRRVATEEALRWQDRLDAAEVAGIQSVVDGFGFVW
jgi:hypothetical protein